MADTGNIGQRGTCCACGKDVPKQGRRETAMAHGPMWSCPGAGQPVEEADVMTPRATGREGKERG